MSYMNNEEKIAFLHSVLRRCLRVANDNHMYQFYSLEDVRYTTEYLMACDRNFFLQQVYVMPLNCRLYFLRKIAIDEFESINSLFSEEELKCTSKEMSEVDALVVNIEMKRAYYNAFIYSSRHGRKLGSAEYGKYFSFEDMTDLAEKDFETNFKDFISEIDLPFDEDIKYKNIYKQGWIDGYVIGVTETEDTKLSKSCQEYFQDYTLSICTLK